MTLLDGLTASTSYQILIPIVDLILLIPRYTRRETQVPHNTRVILKYYVLQSDPSQTNSSMTHKNRAALAESILASRRVHSMALHA